MGVTSVGVIGTGLIGPVHIEGLQRNSDLVRVLGVAGTSLEKARATAERYGLPRAYESWEEMLRDSEIEAVHVCSPNYLHHGMVKEALLAGKHVVCEKPLALTRAEGEELLELATSRGLFHGVHFNLRYYPLVQNLQRKIRSGHLGKLVNIHGGFLQDWLLYRDDYNWRLESSRAGETRVVGDLASHWFDMIEFLTGQRVRQVCADFSTVHPLRRKPRGSVQTFSSAASSPDDSESWEEYQVDTEDQASILFRTDQGVQGSALFSQVAAGRKCYLNFEIHGLDQATRWNSEEPNHIWYGNREGTNQVQIKDPSSMEEEARKYCSYPGGHQEGFGDTVKQFMRDFYSSLQAGTAGGYPSFGDGLREIQVCEALLKSARSGSWQEV
ncbi:Gfo/Idh/MocA family protein [Alkalispirochaeta alkalica]|uniref:Gfo/Idh/MocA family protein n=1 Tax=Alkalispirochaeta alkalica TaxID=46356 RepID=UPI00036B13D3|nr:Gfo/Idh/MocA family oxidoreductase [Alkalispirochaeta alkalica]